MWKVIEGFDCYEVNTMGEIRRIYKTRPPRIVKPFLNHEGYGSVDLCVNNESTRFRVNRLVAMAFIPNPNNLPVVNHKDGVKLNNAVNNLEWCTVQHNTQHAYDNGLIGSATPCISINIETGFINEYVSQRHCRSVLGDGRIGQAIKQGKLYKKKYRILEGK